MERERIKEMGTGLFIWLPRIFRSEATRKENRPIFYLFLSIFWDDVAQDENIVLHRASGKGDAGPVRSPIGIGEPPWQDSLGFESFFRSILYR